MFETDATGDAVLLVAAIEGVITLGAMLLGGGFNLILLIQSMILGIAGWLVLAAAVWFMGTRLLKGSGQIEAMFRVTGFGRLAPIARARRRLRLPGAQLGRIRLAPGGGGHGGRGGSRARIQGSAGLDGARGGPGPGDPTDLPGGLFPHLMPTYRLDLSYDGTAFHGLARQPGLRTVQGEVEQSIAKTIGLEVMTSAAGRTDAGVHARQQVLSFGSESEIRCRPVAPFAHRTTRSRDRPVLIGSSRR